VTIPGVRRSRSAHEYHVERAGSAETRVQAMTERAPVTTLELFFDLVFVFALTRSPT